MRKVKVAILHNIIAPYRFPLFNELAGYNDIDLTVLFMAESSNNRKWNTDKYKHQMNFKYKILPNYKLRLPISDYTEYIINPTILSELKKYDVIITAGWLDFSCQMTYFFSKMLGYKYIVWSESTVNEKSWQRSITLPYVKWAVKNATGYIAIGSKSQEYLISLGAKSSNISIAYSTVDIDHFKHNSRLSDSEKSYLKNTLNIPKDHKIILFVGQFIPRKGVDVLLNAFASIKRNASLVLIGYGPELKTYKEIIAKNALKNVVIIPHVEIDTMPKYYGIADLFVLPSREETWGLVINEAMASGLPVITTDKVGSSPDLVSEYLNGEIVKSDSVLELSAAIDDVLSNKNKIEKYGSFSRKIISKYSPINAARSFHDAIIKTQVN